MEIFDKSRFFNILKNINKDCEYDYIKDRFFKDIEKFNSLFDFINLYDYSLDYVQNRLIIIKNKNTNLNSIKNILICPFDTMFNVKCTPCREVIYQYGYKKRNSYLIKPINEKTEKEYKETHERDCIKGSMYPALLNAVILYMIQNNLLPNNTMVVFSLKSEFNQFHSDDILEYLQERLNPVESHIEAIIEVGITSFAKGMPSIDNYGEVYLGFEDVITAIPYLNKYDKLKQELGKEFNFKDYVSRINQPNENAPGFDYSRLRYYYNINTVMNPRLFVFTNVAPTNKFSTFFLKNDFLTQWKSVENFIKVLEAILE